MVAIHKFGFTIMHSILYICLLKLLPIMKKCCLLLLMLMISTIAVAQKKEKIKGSKNVTSQKKEIGAFDTLEIEDNIEVYLVKGTEQALETEADDNLHDAIQADISGSTMRLYTNKNITSSKKLSVRLTYTRSLKAITAKHETKLYALTELELDSIAVKNLDHSKSFLNVKAGSFSLNLNDKATAEINCKATKTTVVLSKNADLKALISSPEVSIDLYQKSTAAVEGDAAALRLRVDNEAVFNGKKFTAKNTLLTAESYTACSIMVTDTLEIKASGKTEVELYGTPATVTIRKLADSASILKREL